MPSQGMRILVATKPVDFRKGHDGLAALAQSMLAEDPFQNGEPFNAAAVKFTLEQAARPDSMTRPTLGRFTGTVVDDLTIDISSETPEAAILTRFADALYPVAPAYYQEVGPGAFGAMPIGTGAYKVTQWTPGDRLVMEANPTWYPGAPKAEKVVFWIVPESSTRLSTVLTEESDIATQLLPLQTPQLDGSDVAQVVAAEAGSQPILMGIQADRPPFDDPRVREAINLAIDRQAIVDRLLLGYGEAMNQPCGRAAPCFDPDVAEIPYDPERAKELLAEAGATDIKTTLGSSPGMIGPQAAELVQIVSAYLAQVGIEVVPQVEERSMMSSRLYQNGQQDLWDIWLMYYKGGPTAEHALRNMTLGSGGWNWSHYYNDEIDTLWASAGEDFDVESHNASLREISRVHASNYAWGYIFEPYQLYAVSHRLTWVPRVDDLIVVEEMSLASDG